jgi:purine-binding chemotaxis protein CheW
MMPTETENVSLCSMRAGNEWFGCETHKVREVLGVRAMYPVPLAPKFVAGVTPYRGEILMVLCFRGLLGMKPRDMPSTIIVLEDEHNGEVFGLAVDGMGDILNLNAHDFEDNPSALDGRRAVLFEGGYKLGDRFVTHLKPELLWPMRLMSILAGS